MGKCSKCKKEIADDEVCYWCDNCAYCERCWDKKLKQQEKNGK